MEIRKAEPRDLPDIDRLLFQVHGVHASGRPDLFRPGSKKYDDEELRALLNDPARPIYVAEEEGSVRGYVFMEIRDENAPSHVPHRTLYIDDLCVDEAFRGKGVGKTIFAFAKDYARRIGCYDLTLNAWACNPGALAFYEKQGMTVQKYGMEIIL